VVRSPEDCISFCFFAAPSRPPRPLSLLYKSPSHSIRSGHRLPLRLLAPARSAWRHHLNLTAAAHRNSRLLPCCLPSRGLHLGLVNERRDVGGGGRPPVELIAQSTEPVAARGAGRPLLRGGRARGGRDGGAATAGAEGAPTPESTATHAGASTSPTLPLAEIALVEATLDRLLADAAAAAATAPSAAIGLGAGGVGAGPLRFRFLAGRARLGETVPAAGGVRVEVPLAPVAA